MTSILHNLKECARLLSSEKVTERKKRIEELPFLLSNSDVLDALDKNGYLPDKFTWTCLFNSVKKCVEKEAEQIEKESHKSVSATAASARDKRKKACASLIRLVLKHANFRTEPMIKTNNIVNHLLHVMRGEFTWDLFSIEYSNILLKEILAHRRIVREIQSQALEEFIRVYLEFYRRSKSVSHHDLIMQILTRIIRLSYFQTILDASELFSFFDEVVLKSRSTMNLSQQESLMTTCLTFCKTIAVNCRVQLCHFGENIFDCVLSMFDDSISKNFKAILVDFFQLQMVCHHPKGASSEADGMVCCDAELWKQVLDIISSSKLLKKHLHRLYRLLLKELQHPAFRSRHSTKSLGLELGFLELLVDVVHAEIVFIGVNDERNPDPCSSAAKRRRLENGFAFLVDTLRTVGADSEELVAWLQLVGGLLKKYPTTTATFQEIVSLVGVLHQLQLECKRYVIMSPLLDCICSVFGAYLELRPRNNCVAAVKSWTKIYELTVKTVSLNHCIDRGHNLFCALINSKVVSPGPELWCFLTPGLSILSVAPLKTLSAILTHFNVQTLSKKRRIYADSGNTDHGNCTNPLEIRLHLLDWLLPNNLEESSSSVFKMNNSWPTELHARTLTMLALSDQHKINDSDSTFKPINSATLYNEDSLEDIYLQATHDVNILDYSGLLQSTNEDMNENYGSADKYNTLNPVKNRLIEYLLRDCSLLLDPYTSPESQDVVTISAQCCLMVNCIGHFVRTETLSILDLIHTRLFDVLQKLMARLADLLPSFCAEEKNLLIKQRVLSVVMNYLLKFYSWEDGKREFRQTMSQLCREMTSEKLLNFLFDCLYGNVFPNCSISSEKSKSTFFSPKGDFDRDFDEYIIDNSSSGDNSTTMGNDLKFSPIHKYGGFFTTSPIDESTTNVKYEGYDRIVCWTFSDIERLQLNVARVLATWCENSRAPLLPPLRPKSAGTSPAAASRAAVKSRLMEPLIDEAFSFETNFNLHLVFTIISETVKPAHTFDDKCLADLSAILRSVCKVHFKDGEISMVCLNLLSHLLLRLNEYYASGNLDRGDLDLCHRDHVLTLLNGFCVRRSRGQCGPTTELAIIKALSTLAMCDPRLYQSENVPTKELIPSFLKSKYFPVSLHSAKSIQLLLQRGRLESNDFDIKVPNEVFDSVLKFMRNAALSLSKNISLKQQDQQSNWTSSSVLAMCHLAIASPFCLSNSLFEMCLIAKDVPNSILIIRKAMKNISISLRFPSVTDFFDSQIDNLVYRCFEKDLDLEGFIWRLTDSETIQEFYQKHYQSVIPLLFALSKWDRFGESICEALGKTPVDVVTDCFPRIMTFVFPGYVDDNYLNLRHIADFCHGLTETILTKTLVNRQLSSRLDEIVICLLKCIHLDCIAHDTSIMLPPSSPPSYELRTVEASLNYILSACSEKNSSLISILCTKPDGIQNVLLALEMQLNLSHQPHDAYNAFIAYKFFVSLVWKEFECEFQHARPFVLHDVITTLFRLLQRCESSPVGLRAVAFECCILLRSIAESALRVCLDEFCNLVPLFISGLTAFTLNVWMDTVLRDQTISVINFIIVDVGDKLSQTLVNLEPFPDLPIFDSARNKYVALKYADGPLTLKEEVENFLRGLALNAGHLRLEGLQFLRKQLVSRPSELKKLIHDLQSLRLADECSKNVLYCLLVELVHLCCESTFKPEITVEAARCLGELGPLPLSTVVLEASTNNDANLHEALKLFDEDSIAQRNVLIFHKLWTYFRDSSVDVKKVISKVLKSALSTKLGSNFATKYKSKISFPLFDYLHPFTSKTTVSTQVKRITDDEFACLVNNAHTWSPDEAKFEEFISHLCCTLIETGVHGCEILEQLQPACQVKVDFCIDLFPYLIHSILLSDTNEVFLKIISHQIDQFFEKFVKSNTTSSRASSLSNTSHALSHMDDAVGPIYMDKRAIKVMLNTIQFLRLQKKRPQKGKLATMVSPWDDNYRLDIDYLHVAQAAQFCAAHFSALLFVETWCEVKSRELNNSNPSSSSLSLSSISPIFFLGETCPDETKIMQDILLQIYRSIGDPDAIYGCGMAHLSDASVRLQYYEHERRWYRAVFACDLSMRSEASSKPVLLPCVGMPRTLQRLGLQHLAEIYMENACRGSQSLEIREFQSECAWRTSSWADQSGGSWFDEDEKSGFHELVHCSLAALRQGNQIRFQNLLNRAHTAVVLDLKHDSIECMAGLFYPLMCLYTLNNLADFLDCNRNDDGFVGNILSKWSERDAIVKRDYDVLELTINLRNEILQLLLAINGQKQPDILQALVDCEQRQAELARKNGLLQLAETHVSRLRHKPDTMITNVFRFSTVWKLEEAKIFWDGEEHDTAKSLLGILIKELENQPQTCSDLYAKALGLYGNWLIETHSENASIIMENYLEKSISLLERNKSIMDDETKESLMNAYVTTARYADSHYKRIVDYLKSSDYESKQQMIVGSKAEAKRLKKAGISDKDKTRSYMILIKQSEIDSRELESMRDDCLRFLLTAAINYAKCLTTGSSQDIRVFRLVSLWFQNREVVDLNAAIKDVATKVPSHKFLPLIYQLAARLGNNSTIHHKILLEMIEKMTIDHPHHTLLVILALSNATKDDEYLSSIKKPSSMKSKKAEEKERVVAARELLNRIQNKKRLGQLVSDYEKVCSALISFSYWQPPNLKNSRGQVSATSQTIDVNQPIAKLGTMERVPPFTMHIPVDPRCCYENIPGIAKYVETFNFCGGINNPKKVSCRGTDGIVRPELVKGNDDLRQDTVMQQVFSQVNQLLSDNAETACRNLSIRTYKVVPLSQRSGILQWCENTMPFAEYLIGSGRKKGAHVRYFPNDYTVAYCRDQMRAVASDSVQAKYERYLAICKNLQPVFRHFFLENFPDAPIWYERRMAYVRSVATNSIVGHILGLGDRHVNNILVDKRSAEFIHIDLGIAFEQGRILTTPEMVPFRLTRDVVDGMGITGTEGPFRRCCEKTMNVMRSSQEVVLTILEVFLYDPLYQWSLTPLKACKIQDCRERINLTCPTETNSVFETNNDGDAGTSVLDDERTNVEDINKLAERALYRLKQKLQGIEGGNSLSVSGQVSNLIQEAMDPHNLCRMFCGWQAFL